VVGSSVISIVNVWLMVYLSGNEDLRVDQTTSAITAWLYCCKISTILKHS
jgi:hypothetical protein